MTPTATQTSHNARGDARPRRRDPHRGSYTQHAIRRQDDSRHATRPRRPAGGRGGRRARPDAPAPGRPAPAPGLVARPVSSVCGLCMPRVCLSVCGHVGRVVAGVRGGARCPVGWPGRSGAGPRGGVRSTAGSGSRAVARRSRSRPGPRERASRPRRAREAERESDYQTVDIRFVCRALSGLQLFLFKNRLQQ